MWRTGELATEGVRNLLANPTRSMASLMLVAVAVGGLMFAEQRVADDLTRFADDVTAEGGHVVVASAPSPTLRGIRCDRIAAFDGVVAAGTILDHGARPLESAGGALVSVARFSVTALSVIDPTYSGSLDGGYLAGRRSAARFGLAPGAVVLLGDERPVSVVGILDASVRIERFDTALSSAGWIEAGHQCLIEMTPGNREVGREIAAAAFAGTPGLELRTLLPRSAFERDLVAELHARPVRWMWLGVAFVLASAMAVQLLLRRGHRAIYVVHGVGRVDLALLEAFEMLPSVLVGAAVGITWATATAAALGMSLHVAFGLRLAIAAVTATIASVVAISLASYPRKALSDQLKGG